MKSIRAVACGATAAAALSLAATAQAAGPARTTIQYDSVGASQYWTVPPGVFAAIFDVYGAQGNSAVGGKGAEVKTAISVTPGDTLIINVGQRGGAGGTVFGGGGRGPGYGAGGGASDVRFDLGLDHRIIVAGGGGGNGNSAPGGDAGFNGHPGTDYPGVAGTGAAGGGGTQTSGGLGGVGVGSGKSGTNGTLGIGGAGGGYGGGGLGGGGGGGLYGGGGGASGSNYAGGGGGGGSSWGVGNAVYTDGVQTGHGKILISYTDRRTTTTITSSPSPAMLVDTITVTATVAPIGSGTPSGTVQFKLNGNNWGGPVTLDATGKATKTTSGGSLGAGSHKLIAEYSPDSGWLASSSASYTQNVKLLCLFGACL